MRILEPADIRDGRRQKTNEEGVFGVERERVGDEEAAARAERQTVHVLVLGGVGTHAIGVGDDRNLGGVADRDGADPPRRRQVALHQHRRDAEHVADVVEAVARVVDRQQRRDVDVEVEQVADGVGVFGAVQPAEDRAARIGLGGGGAIELADEKRARSASCVAVSGRGMPCGGIEPVPSFRTTFSSGSAFAATFVKSMPSSARPPVFVRSL